MTVKIAQKEPLKKPDPKKDRGKAGVFPKAGAKADVEQVNITQQAIAELQKERDDKDDPSYVTLPEIVKRSRELREAGNAGDDKVKQKIQELQQDPAYVAKRQEAIDGVVATLHLDGNGKEVPEPLKLEEMTKGIIDKAIANLDLPPGTLGFKPQVVINDKIIEPFQTIETRFTDSFCQRLHVDGELVEIYQHREAPLTIPRLKAYKAEVMGREVTFLLDELSSVTITDSSESYPWGRPRSQRGDRALVVLVNSTSNNDQFIGQSLLVNVESSQNVLNHATLRCHNDLENLDRYYPDDNLRLKNDFLVGKSRRMRVVDAQFKHQTVIDTEIDTGSYMNGLIDQVRFKSRNIDVNDCTLKKCQISGSAVKLRKCTLEECQINADGRVEIRKQRFFQKSFYPFSALYLINKFAFTEIHLADAYQDLMLVRTGKETYEIAMGGTVAKLTNPVNDYDLRKAIAAVKREEQVNNWDQDPFSASLNQYVVDSIMSRLKLIAALDKAIDTAEHLTGNVDRYESPFTNY